MVERRTAALTASRLPRIAPNSVTALLDRLVIDPAIFGGKPIVRGRRLAVEHVLGMLAAGDSVDTIVEGYAGLEREDVLACVEHGRRVAAGERVALRFVRAVIP